MLGYPDRAVQVLQTTDAHARRRGHPFDLGWMLTVGTMVWDLHREPEHALARVEEAERLGRTHSLPFISDVLAQVWKGVAWLRAGRLAEGIPQLRGAMETYHAQGGELRMPYYRAVLAEGLALSGDLAGGFQLIEESLTQIARPGWEERWWLAEVLRLKGELLLMQESKEHGARSQEQEAKLGTDPRSLIPDPQNEAEECFLKAIEVAREQQAKSWELRAVMSLVRLRQQQAREQRAASTKQGEGNRELGVRRKEQDARTKRAEAHRMLSEIYHWFTEGFDTKDLQEAKALLDEVSEGE
jgi:predicted ATPase